jgi:hypothetical protein
LPDEALLSLAAGCVQPVASSISMEMTRMNDKLFFMIVDSFLFISIYKD